MLISVLMNTARSSQGLKFNDVNGDGVQQATEPGLPGWVISVGTKSATTAADGTYIIRDVKTATPITEAPPAGTPATAWVQTVGPNPANTGIVNVTGANFGNFQRTSIAGKTYTDLAGDGFTPDDAVLNGITVSLYTDTNANGTLEVGTDTVVGTPQTTAGAGDYLFSDIGPGNYLIQATPPANFSISFPPAPILLTPQSGTAVTGQNFGVFQNITVSGTKFTDLTGDGFSADDTPLNGTTVRLFKDTNNNSTLDSGDAEIASQVTGTAPAAEGTYSFNVGAGLHFVREDVPAGFSQTGGPAFYPINPVSGTNITDLNFGNFRVSTISGLKFNDRNQNGTQDAGEPALAGWTIYLDDNNNGVQEPTETSVVTDVAGNYQFTNLPPATYNLREVQQPGWIQTAPAAGEALTVTLTSGLDSQNNNFGNFFESNTISGQKFNDFNQNQIKDAGEVGLQNWQIFLDSNPPNGVFDQGELTTITDADGNYTIIDVPPGTYQVREVQQNGWTQTTPDPAPVTLNPLDIITGVDFGNFLPQPATIQGLKFRDSNNNGIVDPGEPGLPNVEIRLINVTAGGSGGTPITTTTNSTGNYLFTNLAPGTYRIREVGQTGFTQSTPDPADITLAPGAIVSDINFGNFPTLTPTMTPTPTPTRRHRRHRADTDADADDR
jgi:hypothetical protein